MVGSLHKKSATARLTRWRISGLVQIASDAKYNRGMVHPSKANGGWEIVQIVYSASFAGIAAALMRHGERFSLALRWLPDREAFDKEGVPVTLTSSMNGETEWFVLPSDFAVAVGRALIERKVAGLDGFNEEGFQAMVAWLVDLEVISSGICY